MSKGADEASSHLHCVQAQVCRPCPTAERQAQTGMVFGHAVLRIHGIHPNETRRKAPPYGHGKWTSGTDGLLNYKLMRWARFRHPLKTHGWRYRRREAWRQVDTYMTFSDGTSSLTRHSQMPITRHVIVRGDASPYDGNWVY